MADHPLPDWLDRRTAEWCAQICDHVAATLTRRGLSRQRVIGAEACATNIRAALVAGKPALPAPLPYTVDGTNDG